jgi:4a-hydroxytetrahydrobiopterin dehydratase
MKPVKLSTAEVECMLGDLPAWQCKEQKLHRDYQFKNFIQAFAFMTACALEAEKMNHHPEWRNVWSFLSVDLSTHDVEGITDLDFRLAAKMEELFVGKY